MRMQAHSLPPRMRPGAPLGVDRQWLGGLRIAMVAVTLLSVLLAACAGTGNETTADGTGATALKQRVKARTASAEVRRPAGSSITTASLGKAQTESVVDLPYQPALNSRWVGSIEMRDTTTKAGRIAESIVAREQASTGLCKSWRTATALITRCVTEVLKAIPH